MVVHSISYVHVLDVNRPSNVNDLQTLIMYCIYNCIVKFINCILVAGACCQQTINV